MNNVCLIGRLTKDIEINETQSGTKYARFSVAVQRNYKNDNDEYEADFINCVAWRNTAEFLAKYFVKGQGIGVVGKIQTNKWDKDGTTHYGVEVNCDNVYFTSGKPSGAEKSTKASADNKQDDNSLPAPEGFAPTNDDDLPFQEGDVNANPD